MAAVALLVDRDDDTRRMYAEYLKASAFEIEEADDGRQALAKAIVRRPDVIVTETRLPGMDGFSLCRLLRSDGATRDIPIVVVTGDAFDTDVRRAVAAGADAVLTKPCLPDHLGHEIKRLMTLSRDLREKARSLQAAVSVQLARSNALLERSRAVAIKRTMLSRSFDRRDTAEPPAPPPELRCPTCDSRLAYTHSHIGGVSVRNPEQWDFFQCPNKCGTFEFRQRTRRVRRVA